MCSCPSEDEMFRSIDRWIDQCRWQVLAVGHGDGGGSTWTYTIGLSECFGHPELVVVGACCVGCSRTLINELAERIAAGERFDLATPLVVDGTDVQLRPVEPACWRTSWFAMWHRYYASKPYAPPPEGAMQIVLVGEDPMLALLQVMPSAPSEANRAARRRAARHRR
jgi:hypothetical protein